MVADLADRFEMVLEAVEDDEGWATNRITPGKVILGNLDGIEAGVRQMVRKVPLEVAELDLPSGGGSPSRSCRATAACASAGAIGVRSPRFLATSSRGW